MRMVSCLVMVLFHWVQPIKADELRVPEDYQTIQEAIDIASDGDVIMLANGTFTGEGNTSLVIENKSITLTSENGPDQTIIDCLSEGWGIRVQNAKQKAVAISGVTITNAISGQNGAGISANNTNLAIDKCTISRNVCKLNEGKGGGLFLSNSTVYICESTFSENDTSGDFSYGGAMCLEESIALIEDSFVLNNTNSGGMAGDPGIVADRSEISILKCQISGNYFNGISGGFLLCQSSGLITDTNFSNNFSNYGAAGTATLNSSLKMARCTMQGNVVRQRGGALFIDESSADIRDCIIIDNSSERSSGAVYLHYAADVVIADTRFQGNTAALMGGALWVHHCSPAIFNCLFTGNTASSCGGAVNAKSGNPGFYNCTIADNETTYDSGGGCYGVAPYFRDCIIWNNIPNQLFSDNGIPIVEFSNVMDGFPGTGNINAPPLFISQANGDYFLSHIDAGQDETSPCIDAGSDNAADICVTINDQDYCMNTAVVRTDGITDSGMGDMGYHVRPLNPKTPTPTPIPPCLELGSTIDIPGDTFQPGDEFFCDVVVCNPGSSTVTDKLLVSILEAYSDLYLLPVLSLDITPGLTTHNVVPQFVWPDYCGEGQVTLYSAMTDEAITELFGTMDSFSFHWHE